VDGLDVDRRPGWSITQTRSVLESKPSILWIKAAPRSASIVTRVMQLLAGGDFFWLDLDQPSDGDFQILRNVFKFHPLAIEDSEHFDQRATLHQTTNGSSRCIASTPSCS